MSAYLGKLGQLVPIYSTPGMSVTGLPERTYETSLEGRVQAQVKAKGGREWGLEASLADPGDVGALMAFALGEWGIGPFVWVSPTAANSNLLTPEVSTCGPAADVGATVTVGGPLTIAGEGVAGRSLSNSNTASNLAFGNTPIPVMPNTPVTASAGLLGAGAQMGVNWWTAAGVYISANLSAALGVAGEARRISVTATPPENAAYCQIYGVATAAAARPAVTWTNDVLEWQAGEGCPKAVIDAVERNSRLSSSWVGGNRHSDLSFVIREVGN